MLGILKIAGTVGKFVLGPLVGLANKAPAGTLTGIGAVAAAAGAATAALNPHVVTNQNIVEIINAVAGVVTAVGTIIVGLGAQRARAA